MLRGLVRYQNFLVNNDKTNTTTKVESRRSKERGEEKRENDSSESNEKKFCVRDSRRKLSLVSQLKLKCVKTVSYTHLTLPTKA